MTHPDRLALADLVHRYAAMVDDRRFADVVDLFAHDAELVVPDAPRSLDPVIHHHGRQAIRDAVAAVAAVDRTEHAIVGEVYTASGPDQARGRITCAAHHWKQGDEQISDLVWHLRYDDEYVRTGRTAILPAHTDHQRDRDPASAPAAGPASAPRRKADTVRPWIVWSTGLFAYIVAVLDRTTFGVSGLQAAHRYAASPGVLSSFVVLQVIVYAATQVPAGVLLDEARVQDADRVRRIGDGGRSAHAGTDHVVAGRDRRTRGRRPG